MRKACFLAVFLLLPASGMAAIVHVPAEQPNIMAGIAAAQNGDTVLLAPGTYSGIGNRDIIVSGPKSFRLASEAGAATTIIDCHDNSGENHRAFYFSTGGSSSITVEGITIRRGYFYLVAGGVLIENSSPNFKSCVFADNWGHHGGGFYATGSFARPSFIDCRFTRNTAGDVGGAGLVRFGADAYFENCLFDSNTALNGAFLCYNASPTLVNCRFTGNVTTRSGGAIFLQDNCSPTITNCLFDHNRCDSVGGAIYINERGIVGGSCEPLITNCTFVHNYGAAGAAIYIDHDPNAGLAQPIFSKCLLVYNTGTAAVLNINGTPQANCSDIFGNPGGDWTDYLASQLGLNGNITTDPLFCDAKGDDFHPAGISPCAPANNTCGQLLGALEIACPFPRICGDVNDDGQVSWDDVTSLQAFYFACEPLAVPWHIADVDCDNHVTLADIVYLGAYLNGTGSVPCAGCR